MPVTLASNPSRPAEMRRTRSVLACVGVALACFAAGFFLAPRSERGSDAPSPSARTWLPSPVAIGEFSLDTVDGEPGAFTRGRLLGHWTLMYFGYSHCPDVCRPALEALVQVAAELGTRRPRLQIERVFVTVDPARDTPARLRDYASRVDAGIVALHGSEKRIAGLARQVGILYARQTPGATGGYLVDHPATILLIDPQARLRAGFPLPHDPARIVDEILDKAPALGDERRG